MSPSAAAIVARVDFVRGHLFAVDATPVGERDDQPSGRKLDHRHGTTRFFGRCV